MRRERKSGRRAQKRRKGHNKHVVVGPGTQLLSSCVTVWLCVECGSFIPVCTAVLFAEEQVQDLPRAIYVECVRGGVYAVCMMVFADSSVWFICVLAPSSLSTPHIWGSRL